jgi:hypothetical protein
MLFPNASSAWVTTFSLARRSPASDCGALCGASGRTTGGTVPLDWETVVSILDVGPAAACCRAGASGPTALEPAGDAPAAAEPIA